jgi:hypothetical protein
MAVPPSKVMKPLARFCATIVPNRSPEFVAVKVQPTAVQEECFENVRLHVARHGGQAQHGWAIWEWPKVYWEAEFHCVWRSAHGELIDITPNNPAYPWILFLPDPVRVYRDRLVENIRKPLIRDKLLDEFYRAAHDWHQLKSSRFLPDFVETPEWMSEAKRLKHYRDLLSVQMLHKFGDTMMPVMKSRLSSPMPKM